MSSKINIAIDGHSSCGKSTIAKSIAVKYNMNYIDNFHIQNSGKNVNRIDEIISGYG